MNNKLLSFFRYLDLSPEVVDELCRICPRMFEYDADNIVNNISLVISSGYPKADIGELLLINPNFVFNDYNYLKQILNSIEGNVETELNQNPFLI